ncbi:MAG: T9SS type A sorting domain-containing protein, partial [Acidobacteriaceae bacterium]
PVNISLSPATPQIVPAGPVVLCAPDTAVLDASTGFATYQWSRDGTLLNGATSQSVVARTSGNYSVEATNSAGCSGTSQSVSVTINPLPAQPVITASADTLVSTRAATYQWSQAGAPIPGATNRIFVADTGGTFTVTTTDSNGCSSTSEPFSNAGSTVIAVPSMVTAKESNDLTIPLEIVSSQSLPQSVDRAFTAVLRFNKTLLVPQDGSFVSKQVQGNDLVVTYAGTSSATQGVLMNLPFTATLGEDSCTTVTIDKFAWSTPNISVTTQNGNFCLTGLCTQGGTRLVNPEGAVTLSQPIPNPAFNSIEIDYNLIEQGKTTITLYDVLGHEVMSLLDDTQKPGAYSVVADISGLPAGRYIYTLRTPTIVESQNLQIVR